MSPVSAFLFQATLLLVPGFIAALGGCAALWLRQSSLLVRIVQPATAAALFGLGLACRHADFSWTVWFAPTLCGLVLLLQLLAGFAFLRALTIRALANVHALTAPRRWGLLLMGASPLLLAGSLWQIDVMVTPETGSFDQIRDYPEADLVEATGISAFTDRGRRIPIYKVPANKTGSLAIAGEQGLPMENTPVPYRAIRLADANADSNCTGWVFTGAHSWIQCRDVQNILDDNGYHVNASARPGDLVIYRDDAGAIVHVGCVASLVGTGRPMIESKWGYQGLFLHLPEGTPYGDAWSYYRSKRPDHMLHTSSSGEDANGRAAAEIAP